MSNIQVDPYAILQIDRNASPDTVKKAYRALAKVYHPDKPTGNTEMFKILTQAFNDICTKFGGGNGGNMRDVTGSNGNYSRESIDVPIRGGGLSRDNYTQDKFNQNFRDQSRGNEVDFVYGVDDSMYRERNLSDYKREREMVKEDLENTRPLFNKGMGFDRNVFNRMFEKLKGGAASSELVKYTGEPRAMVSQNAIGFSSLNPHAEQRWDISTSDLKNNYQDLNMNPEGGFDMGEGGGFSHPDSLDQDEYQSYRDQPDITKISSLSKADMKRKMSEYNNVDVTNPRGAKPPTGDLDYDFDPYYYMPASKNQLPKITNGGNGSGNGRTQTPMIEYHGGAGNGGRQMNSGDGQMNSGGGQMNNRGGQNRNNNFGKVTNNRVAAKNTMASYIPTDGGTLGKPMQPQITYYTKTQTTEQYVMPPNRGGGGGMGMNGGGGMGMNGGGGMNNGGMMDGPDMDEGPDMSAEFYQQFNRVNQSTRGMPDMQRNGGGMDISNMNSEFPHMNYRVPPASVMTGNRMEAGRGNGEPQAQNNMRNELRDEIRNEMRNELRINELRMQEMKKNELLRRKQEAARNRSIQQPTQQQQMTLQDDARVRDMEAELNQLRKKAMIQDKLLKKIKKQALSGGMNQQ